MMNNVNPSGLNVGFRTVLNYLDQRTEDLIQEQYKIQNKDTGTKEENNISPTGFRQEDRNGVFIRSKEGDTAQLSYTAINFQRNSDAAEVGQEVR